MNIGVVGVMAETAFSDSLAENSLKIRRNADRGSKFVYDRNIDIGVSRLSRWLLLRLVADIIRSKHKWPALWTQRVALFDELIHKFCCLPLTQNRSKKELSR